MCIIFITFNVHKLYIQLRCHAGPLANGVESLEVAGLRFQNTSSTRVRRPLPSFLDVDVTFLDVDMPSEFQYPVDWCRRSRCGPTSGKSLSGAEHDLPGASVQLARGWKEYLESHGCLWHWDLDSNIKRCLTFLESAKFNKAEKKFKLNSEFQNITGFRAFNTIKSQWSGGKNQVQVQVFSLFLLFANFATDFQRLFLNRIEYYRRPCGQGRTLERGSWVLRAQSGIEDFPSRRQSVLA